MHRNKNGSQHSAMMWMMVLCCAFPLLVLLFGVRQTASDRYLLGALAFMLLLHLWMMRTSHGNEGEGTKDRSCH